MGHSFGDWKTRMPRAMQTVEAWHDISDWNKDSIKNWTGNYLLCGLVKNPAAPCLCLHNLSEAKFGNNGLICEMEETSG